MKITNKIKLLNSLKQLLPPVFIVWMEKLRYIHKPPVFEYVAEGWERSRSDDRVKGWNEQSIVDIAESKWDAYADYVAGTAPLGISFEARDISQPNLGTHNSIICYGYILALSAHNRDQVSILDWGGGIGYYALLASALLPDQKIDYYCKDMPLMCEHGKKLLPQATFYISDSEYSGKQFDCVMASGSLQYAENWREAIALLAKATGSYLYITRLPVIEKKSSFVMIQRPYGFGYETEYLSWCLNRNEFLAELKNNGMKLVREFMTNETIHIKNAPEQCRFSGFLFKAI